MKMAKPLIAAITTGKIAMGRNFHNTDSKRD
jgi:hypothetical protein